MDDLDDGNRLWAERYLTDGRLVIARGSTPVRRSATRAVLERAGRWWRSLRAWEQAGLALLVAAVAGVPFRSVHDAVAVGVSVGALLVIGVLALVLRDRPPPTGQPAAPTEAMLVAGDTTEARVAAAATRAWRETTGEPAWRSPHLARSRAAFDGQAQVDRIIDLALGIFGTRIRLGARPQGPAAEYWERQQEALEQTAAQLGERADALIRYRDQAALLSAELQHLAALESLESTALEIQDLTARTAPAESLGDGDLSTVADEIACVREAMTELVDLMTGTLAPLSEPEPRPLSILSW